MGRKLAIVLFCLVLAAMFVPLQAQDLNFTGAGARAAGMGNAFTGVADDATAISWNSAGLTQLYSMEASVIARLGFGSFSTDGLDNASDIEYKSKFNLNFLSFVIPFSVGKLNVVGGIAYRTLIDFNQELVMDGETFFKTEGGVRALSPAIAVQLNDMFSVGATLNIYGGSYKEESDPDEETYSGAGLDIGVLLKPSPRFTIGANMNLPNTLKWESSMASGEIDVPFFFSIGAGFRATDQFLIAFDYVNRNWANSDNFKDSDFADLYNLSNIHLGLEYLLMSGNAIIPLRLGFYTSPQFGYTKGYDSEDQLVNSVITLGGGLIMGNFVLDGSFEIEPSETKMYDSFLGEYTFNQNLFRVTIGGTIHFGN